MSYNQFCPLAKAMDLLGERWTLLIVRELLMGATRFNELQRGLTLISPTILTKRLNELAEANVVLRKKIPGQKGYEYQLTEMGRDLMPAVEALGAWGMRWARGTMNDDELDVELLMLYLERSILRDKLPNGETIIRFQFTNLSQYRDWWILVKPEHTEVCLKDPGREVDVYFTVDLRTMTEVWMGDCSFKAAMADGRLKLVGNSALTRSVSSWLALVRFAQNNAELASLA